MTQFSQSLKFLVFIVFIVVPIQTFQNCDVNQTAIGCISCNSSFSLAYNISQSKFTCTDIENCTSLQSDQCSSCASPSILNQINYTCQYVLGCVQYNFTTNACMGCSGNYILLYGDCYEKTIPFCRQYDLNNGILQCIKCQYNALDSDNSCRISNSTLCAVFDFGNLKCGSCPTDTIIQSKGTICYQIVNNCLYYDDANPSKCIQCRRAYIYDVVNNNCILGNNLKIDQQIVVSYNLDTFVPIYSYTCINRNQGFYSNTSTCITTATSHCLININSTVCATCIQGYYLSLGKCYQCDIYLQNCALCSNKNVCTSCKSGYYLLKISNTQSLCMSCSSYGCLTCSTVFNQQNKVQCLSCPVNSTLFAGSCIECQTRNSSYSIQQSKCKRCDLIIPNCQFCIFTDQVLLTSTNARCTKCIDNYYLNVSLCVPINSNTIVQYTTAAEILPKVASGIDRDFYYDKTALLSVCNDTDGFICLCKTATLTSLCTNITVNPILLSLVFNTTTIIAQYSDQLRLVAQFPSFNQSTSLTSLNFTSSLLTQYQFWNLLQALSFIIIRQQAQISTPTSTTQNILKAIYNYASQMSPIFSDQKITILRGNGFYFKYIPAKLKSSSIGDDGYITTTLSDANIVIIYAYYSKVKGQKVGLMTGNTYIFTDNPAEFNVTVKKTRYYDNSSNLKVYVQGFQQNKTITLSNGFITINNVPRFNVNNSNGFAVYGTGSTQIDPYVNQRIQNIFYNQSWLYILFFIALYLVFIPLCAIVDCCQNDQYTRKKINSNQPSQDKPKTQQQNSDATIVKINYRDFFPIYNVGNTPRPRRLTKVCLFIVNMQHIITFLTLCYFKLGSDKEIVAILLAIPAYLCSVIMGYIIGAIFRILPGHFKYLINILSLGYWLLWIFLMKILSSSDSRQYRLFILVFAILSFFLDMIIDALETLLVYFAIRQQEQQITLFNCLARWLSRRGYYQFDKLAKQINEADQ